jgi:hypothetical protein
MRKEAGAMVERVVRRKKVRRRSWDWNDRIEIIGVLPKSAKQQRQELIDELRPLAPKRNGDFILKRIAMWPEGRENYALAITAREGTLTVTLTPEMVAKMRAAFEEDTEMEVLFDA